MNNHINKELLLSHLENGIVFRQKHPTADLWIYNYADKCQYEGIWDNVTKQCRGLILDNNFNYVTRPFQKFHNISEHKPEEIPYHLPFEVFTKLDGSFLEIYWLDDKPYFASRGSFNSDQANHANKILYQYYQHTFKNLDKNKTYIFELITKWNQIVVDYGDMDDVVLIAITDSKTGEDLPLDYDLGFKVVEKHDGIKDINKLKDLEEPNKEGFVIKFSNGFRCKLKFDEYVRLHRIVTGISTVTVWEYLSQNKSFDELLSKVPDEWYKWLKQTQNELLEKYALVENNTLNVYNIVVKDKNYSRKEIALILPPLCSKLQMSIIFRILDNKDYSDIIWKYIKPKFSKAFSNQI